jgi:hypothetical protein
VSGLGVAALVVAGVWLAVLTLLAVLTVRQVGLLTVRLDRMTEDTSGADDGLEVGAAVPAEVTAAVPGLDGQPGYLLVISAGCEPCRELAGDLEGETLDARVVALLTGESDIAGEMAALFPPQVELVRDPHAASALRGLEVQTTPFVFEVDDGQITGKSVLRGADDLLSFMEGRERSEAAEPPLRITEVEGSAR